MTYLGVDLGKINDFTAICVLEREEVPSGVVTSYMEEVDDGVAIEVRREEKKAEYRVRHLERHLGKTYTELSDRILEVKDHLGTHAWVVVDATGVGRPVVDLLTERGLEGIIPVLITAGDRVNQEDEEYRVPKRDLVGAMQVLTQNGDLKIPASLDLRDALVTEMQNFKVKRSAETGHESFEHWRSGDHDDLVLSLAMPLWFAEYTHRKNWLFA